MPGWNSRGFEIGNVLDRRAYPTARLRRLGPPPSAGGEAAAIANEAGFSPPVSRVFTFKIIATANNRSTVSSPLLRGPTLIRGFHVTKQGTPDGTHGIALGKSKASITELNVATTTARPFTSLFTGLPAGGGAVGPINDTTDIIDSANTILTDSDNLGIIVLDRDWFLTVSISAGVVGSDTTVGFLTLLDQVSDALLAQYIG